MLRCRPGQNATLFCVNRILETGYFAFTFGTFMNSQNYMSGVALFYDIAHNSPHLEKQIAISCFQACYAGMFYRQGSVSQTVRPVLQVSCSESLKRHSDVTARHSQGIFILKPEQILLGYQH